MNKIKLICGGCILVVSAVVFVTSDIGLCYINKSDRLERELNNLKKEGK